MIRFHPGDNNTIYVAAQGPLWNKGDERGLYKSTDGGKTWEKKSEEDGLPKGNLGRIGLAISQSNPKVVYALIEAKKNDCGSLHKLKLDL